MQKFPSRPRNVTQKDKFLFITTNLSDVCLSICRFRRVITHRHANHFGQTSYPSNTLILVLLLTLPPALPCNPLFHGRTFIPSHTQLFPPSFLNTAVGRFFFSSHLSPQCLFLSRLHYRPSLRILPLLSRAFLKITSDLFFPFCFILLIAPPAFKGVSWKYLDSGGL